MSIISASFGLSVQFQDSLIGFGATVESRMVQSAKPAILNLKFLDNKVCIHPQSTGPKSTLVWIGFATIQGEKTPSNEIEIPKEVEPFLGSLEFVITG